MMNHNNPPAQEIINEIPRDIINTIGTLADTGPTFEFPPAGTQKYAGVRFTNTKGETTGVVVVEDDGNGGRSERTLTGDVLRVFLEANPDIDQ